MSDKFLGSGQGSINLSNGSATIYSATLGAASLTASKPIKTNSVKQLISTNLDITDVNNLQTQLNEKDELTFVEDDTHTTPASGKNKIYFKTDGNLYKKDDTGTETLVGGGSVSGPASCIDNSVVFFDGTTGDVIKEKRNFTFVTGITYGDQLKVPDIETDDHFSINGELTTLDAAITTNTANITTNTTNNTGSVTIHNDVSNAGSGKIITNDERNDLTANTNKTQNITATAGVTTFSGTIGSDNVKATNEVAIGTLAGENTQGSNSVAIGNNAGNNTQGSNSIAVGTNAANLGQGTYSVALGYEASLITQGNECVAIGFRAGKSGQLARGVSIGRQAGETTQGTQAVAVGWNAGNNTQGSDTVAIGTYAGATTQQNGAVAIGDNAGRVSQGTNGVAIGIYSGNTGQGANSIAVGKFAGLTNQSANSIILNATGSTLDATSTGTFIKPLRNQSTTDGVFYNSGTGELSYSVTNNTASAGLTEFTGKVSANNPHLTYTTTVTSEGPDAGLWNGGDLQVGMLFTPETNIKMTKLYLTERQYITIDNVPRVSIFGVDLLTPLIVFDIDETTKITPATSTYGYYTKDIQFEFEAGIEYSIQCDLYAGNGNDNNIKTYPAVLGQVLYGFWNGSPSYRKIASPQVNNNIPFILDCEDNVYTNYFSINDNNLSKDIYGAGGILDRTTVRASNMRYNMKNTAQSLAYPDGVGYKTMFYNPTINEICYSSKEVVNDFYYMFNSNAPDFYKDNMMIFSWTNSTGLLQLRSTGALPSGMIINSSLIGGAQGSVYNASVSAPATTYGLYSGEIPSGSRLDAFVSSNSVYPGLMPAYHIICHRTGGCTTIWIKRIQDNTQ